MTDDQRAQLLIEFIKLQQKVEFIEVDGNLERAFNKLSDLIGLNEREKEIDLCTFDHITGKLGEFSVDAFLHYNTINDLKIHITTLKRDINKYKRMLAMKEDKLNQAERAYQQVTDIFGLNKHVNEHFTEAVFDYTMRKGTSND